ncbi:MAG: hypothetical protein DI537_05310 [Stutzerimonas stutzeri]|nr:MAG: hypothetical protein DI537_05310 [Stutzerimonas stutzeri]
MSEIVRSISDIDRKLTRARERHELLRAERLREIVCSIEAAMNEGAEEISSVLQTLSEGERKDLYDHFPAFLSSLHSAASLEDLMAITRGVTALRGRVLTPADRPARDMHLSRHALAFAKAPNADRAEVVRDLALLARPPETLAGALWLWFKVHGRLMARRFVRRA